MEFLIVLCGAAGVGKTHAARALAGRLGLPLAEGDDIVTAVKAMTSAEQQPALHYWDEHPQAGAWPPERIADLHLTVAEVLRPAFEAVVADHVRSGTPVVLEGDYLLPELALSHLDAARAVVLVDESGDGEQNRRAQVSALVGSRLAERARGCGVPVVPARPWADQVDRILDAIRPM